MIYAATHPEKFDSDKLAKLMEVNHLSILLISLYIIYVVFYQEVTFSSYMFSS